MAPFSLMFCRSWVMEALVGSQLPTRSRLSRNLLSFSMTESHHMETLLTKSSPASMRIWRCSAILLRSIRGIPGLTSVSSHLVKCPQTPPDYFCITDHVICFFTNPTQAASRNKLAYNFNRTTVSRHFTSVESYGFGTLWPKSEP